MALPPIPVPMVTLNWGDDLNDYLEALSVSLSEPAGIIKPFAGTVAPPKHALCDGAVVPRGGIYAALFSAIGTRYGVGDGSTNFVLPNLRGRLLVGIDSTQTEFDATGPSDMYGGAKTHTVTAAELPPHVHDMSHDHGWSGSYSAGYLNYAGPRNARDYPASDVNEVPGDPLNVGNGAASISGDVHTLYASTGAGPGGGLGHNNLMPYGLTNYIITLGN